MTIAPDRRATHHAATHPHAPVIEGLKRLAEVLYNHPDLPLGDHAELAFFATGSNADQCAQVRQLAEALDVQPGWIGDSLFLTRREFGAVGLALYTAFVDEPDAIAPAAPKATETTLPIELAVEGALPERDCPGCNGSGSFNGNTCRLCLGKGRILLWQPKGETW